MKGHRNTCLIQIFLKHLGLPLLFTRFVIHLSYHYCTSSSFWEFFGDLGDLGGDLGTTGSLGYSITSFLVYTFFGSGTVIYYLRTSSFFSVLGLGGIYNFINNYKI